MKIFSVVVVITFSLLFGTQAIAEEFAIPGTGDGVAVLKSISKVFGEKTGVVVRVPDSIGSGGGVKAAGADKVVLARVARAIKEKEKPFGLSYTAIFKVPTVFFVHTDVAVKNLSEKQILDIFSGTITNWKDVGGQDAKIFVVRREDGDSSLNNLRKTFTGFKDITITKDAMIAPKTPVMVAQIKNRQNAIGFGPLDVGLESDLKVLTVNGQTPGKPGYPYYGTIGLVYKNDNLKGIYQEFIKFTTSAAAHTAIKSAGGVPIK